MLFAVGGFQMLQFGQFWLVHELNDSTWMLGYVGLANAIPSIVLNLYGGVIADRVDQRRLVIVTQTMTAALVLVLAILVATDVARVWHVLAIAMMASAINAFNQPARQALYPHLIPRDALMSAVALNSSIWQGTRIVAPAIAGLLIWLTGTAAAFYLAAIGIFGFAVVVYFIQVDRITVRRESSAVADLVEGLKFIRGNSIFSFLIGMTFFNSFFGMAYVTLMPVFAVEILDVGSQGQGILMSTGGVGALLTTIYLGTRKSFRKRGLILVGGAVLTGISIAAFALTAEWFHFMPLSMVFLFIFGAASSAYMISIMSSLQMMVPDQMRGRVMGFYGMTWNIMPLGGMYAGALAAALGAPWTIAIGGFLVSGFALGPALLNRQVRDLGGILGEAEDSAAAKASA